MTEVLTPAQLRRELERKVPEKTVLAAGLKTFALQGWTCWRNNVGGVYLENSAEGSKKQARRYVAFGSEGLPDITGYTPWGAHVAAEAKRPSGDRRLDPPQAAHLAAVRKAGGIAIVFSSAQELQDAIEYYELRHKLEAARCLQNAAEQTVRERRCTELWGRIFEVERRFEPRPGDEARYLIDKSKRRARSRARRRSAG